METLERILAEHPFFEALEPDYLKLLTGCASNVRFDAGQYIFRRGEAANQFYLLRHGRVALEIFAPQARPSPSPRSSKTTSWAGPGSSNPTTGTSTRAPWNRPRHRPRRQMPPHQVRTEPRSRLRTPQALRPPRRTAAGSHPPAAIGCLCPPPLTSPPPPPPPDPMGPMLPQPYRVETVLRETPDTFTFALDSAAAPAPPRFAPGQFSMLYVFGVGELPISISGDPDHPAPSRLHRALRRPATQALVSRQPGRLRSACAAPSARLAAARGARQRRADRRRRHRPRPPAPGHSPHPAPSRRVRPAHRALRRAQPARPPLPQGTRSLGSPARHARCSPPWTTAA